jgi:membrane protein
MLRGPCADQPAAILGRKTGRMAVQGGGLPQSGTTGLAASGKVPSWTVLLSALFLSVAFSSRRASTAASTYATDQAPALSAGAEGHIAEAPSPIPVRGWKGVLLRVYQSVNEERLLLVAAGVTFYTLLAIFPGIAALISIYGLFADPATVTSHLDTIANVAPSGAIDVLRDQMARLALQGGTKLGIGFLVSLAISLWTANSGIKALFDALNIAYDEEEKRGFFKLTGVTLLVTAGIIAFILLTLGAVVALPVVLDYVPQPGLTLYLVKFGRWPILFILVTLALEILYWYGPSRKEPRWRWVSWGSAVAAIVWLVASVLFSWYVANFGSYNKTYGSLGAIIGFMTWIWISIIVVLVGAKLNAEMQHQTARETIIGQPAPLGSRATNMANAIGAAQE